MKNNKHVGPIAHAGIALYLLLAYLVFTLADRRQFFWLDREDGYFEWVGALSLLGASIVFFLTFLRSPLGTNLPFVRSRKSLVLLFLALLFLFGAGEELRWGQALIDIKTPDILMEGNIKGELSLHNLAMLDGKDENDRVKTGLAAWLTIEKAFSVFWFSYCCLLPAIVLLRPPLGPRLETIGVPLVPPGLGLLFMVNYVLSKFSKYLPTVVEGKELIEAKEANFSFLFLIVSLYFFYRYVSRPAEPDRRYTSAGAYAPGRETAELR